MPRPAVATPTVPMARVVRVATPAPVATVTIAVGGAHVEVRDGFDPALLRDVVAALGGAS